MKTKDAIKYFGSIKQVASALGLTVQAIYAWGDDVPALRAYQLREIMNDLSIEKVDAGDTAQKIAA